MTDRIITLVDMDCFYCQVETRLNPSLQGIPMAVVQYNEWKGGGIIAVNYEARARGVTRFMRGDEAKRHCPEIELVHVPTLRGKADLTKYVHLYITLTYRDASREVVAVFCTFSDCVERASIDEAYIDLTSAVEQRLKQLQRVQPSQLANSFVVGYSQQNSNEEDERSSGLETWLGDLYGGELYDSSAVRLAVGGVIVEEMRQAVYERTGFRCSAGIAHNKILAKLCCGLHKPNRQTILPHSSVAELYSTLPLKKVRSLGGKFGEDLTETLGCKTMADLARFTERKLQQKYDDKTGTWLYNIARGFDYDPVTPRLISKSIGCCKKFPGRMSLASAQDIQHWLGKLIEDLVERLLEDQEMNKRKASLLTISVHLGLKRNEASSLSRSISLPSYDAERIMPLAYMLIKRMANVTNDENWSTPITFLGLSAGKFVEMNSTNSISHFFKATPQSDTGCGKSDDAASIGRLQDTEIKLEQNKDVGSSEGDANTKSRVENSFFRKFLQRNSESVGQKLNICPKIDSDLVFQDSNSCSDIFETRSNCELGENSNSRRGSEVGDDLVTEESAGSNAPIKELSSRSNPTDVSSELRTNKENKSNGTIFKYFRNNPSERWIDPSEIFPDLSCVDDEIISSLPLAFRKKILALKERSGEFPGSSEPPKSEAGAVDKGIPEGGRSSGGCELSAPNPAELCEVVRGQKITKENEEGNGTMPITAENLEPLENHKEEVSIDNERYEKICSECQAIVPLFCYEEHSDMHLAERLDREWNHVGTVQNSRAIAIPVVSGPKRKNLKKGVVNKNKKFRSIQSFFNK
ncbi:hypothetical protein AAG570_001636 [Ranatra chinensis]|uniref:DNA polymerase eta n=1 Tax=Ranatra chinensis TaxID=642074 RepID=A0ABD0Y941_9HEMI